tara:strand:- start:88 stop:603 length:516 start_codon:yes stop_codon:yes gene_type:complete
MIIKTKTFKKGTLGESIVIETLKKLFPEYDILTQNIKDKAHWVDLILMNKINNDIKYIEVKTKARLNKYPMTGIDYKHYQEYIRLNKKGIDVIIFFVDDKLGDIHYLPVSKAIELENQNKIKILDFKQRNINKKTICWFLEDMKFITKISKDQIDKLTKLDERNHNFKIYN